MLHIHPDSRERFDQAKDLARRLGLTGQFASTLRRLQHFATNIGGPPRVRVTLGPDFAPYSFALVWERRHSETGEWIFWFNGGLIYHGPHDHGGDGGAPTFSVNLEPCHGWRVHT